MTATLLPTDRKAGEAAAHVQADPHGERLKAVAVASTGRLTNSPSTSGGTQPAMIGFIFLLVFLVLFAKALFETAWGGCLIIWGVICQAIGAVLLALAFVLDCAERLKMERRRHGAFSHCFAMKTTIALLATLLVTTLPGVSQEPTKTGSEKPTQTETTATPAAGALPAARTVTDLKGRAMVGTILSKTETAISFVRAADQKKFEIQLDTLSEADRTFIAGLVAPAVKKPRMLFFANPTAGSKMAVEKIKAAGFDLQVADYHMDMKKRELVWPILEKLSDNDLKAYDVIWAEGDVRDPIYKLIPTYNGVMVVNRNSRKLTRATLIKPEPGQQTFGAKSFVKVDENVIIFSENDIKWNSKTSGQERGEPQPERYDEVIAAIKTLQAGEYPPR